VSTAIRFDPDAAAATLLAEQSERERVVRELAASYGEILEGEHALEQSRAKHLQLRQQASEFGITDAALKKAGIPAVAGTSRGRGGSTRRSTRRTATPTTTPTPENTRPTGGF